MLLVDTHVVVWLAADPGRFSRKAAEALAGARNSGEGLAVSSITLFELAQLVARRRIQIDIPVDLFLAEVEERFAVLPLSARVAARMLELPARYPGDPADRIIGATALVQNLALVTADERIRNSKAFQTIW